MNNVVLATGNQGKIKELNALLSPLRGIPQKEFNLIEAEETGLSFIENAIIKARHASVLTNRPALADDSGLVVPALHGAPGIFSARFAGKDASDAENSDLLLQRLENHSDRRAYFYCAIALVKHPNDPTPFIATGQWEGEIALTKKGEHGFGYDPIFFVPSHNCTAAELDATLKNQISHRAQALKQLKALLNSANYLSMG